MTIHSQQLTDQLDWRISCKGKYLFRNTFPFKFILQVRARASSRSSLLYCTISIPRPSVKLGRASPQGRQTPVPRRIECCCHTIRQRGFPLCYSLHTLFNQKLKCHWYIDHWKMFTTGTIANCWFWRRPQSQIDAEVKLGCLCCHYNLAHSSQRGLPQPPAPL